MKFRRDSKRSATPEARGPQFARGRHRVECAPISTFRLFDFSIIHFGSRLSAFGFWLLPWTCITLFTRPASAGPTSKAIRETAEFVVEKFAKEAGEETVETLSAKIARLAAQHGDEAVAAVRRVGPKAFRLADEAGANAPQAIKLLARVGDDAVWVVSRPRSLALFAKYGDDAADAMLKHRQIAEPLLETYGPSAARALKAVDGQGGRRLAMLFDEGHLASTGRGDELLGVMERFGDRALDFIWRHKGPLTGGAVLGAFIANPQPYLDGVVQLTGTVGAQVGRPIAEISREAARSVNWTLVLLLGALLTGMWLAVRSGRRSLQ